MTNCVSVRPFGYLKADLRLALCLLPRVLSDEREERAQTFLEDNNQSAVAQDVVHAASGRECVPRHNVIAGPLTVGSARRGVRGLLWVAHLRAQVFAWKSTTTFKGLKQGCRQSSNGAP